MDWAREKAGLVSATEADQNRADRHFENEMARLSPPPPPKWSPLQACPACGAIPADESGALIESDLEQFWCDEHKDQAAPGDLEKHVPAIIGLDGNLAPVYSERERARIAAWYAQREEEEENERRERQEDDEAKAEALAKVRERFDREGTVSVMGIEVHPGDVHVR